MPKEIMDKFIAEHPEVEWVNLQQEGGYLTSDLWVDTADKVQALDAVISVDSAIAHIAGSVGVPVANLIGGEKLSCWRWYPKLNTTYWYDTMITVWFDKWEDGLKEALTKLTKEKLCNAVDTTGNKGKTKTTTRARPAGTATNNKRGAGRKI
jgi:ADP-heptose:LPS heptosyltransferase